MTLPDYYEVLQVHPRAEPEVIKAAYRGLAKKYHPDGEQPDEHKMLLINEAYEVLSDPLLRSQYDSKKTSASVPPSAQQSSATSSPSPNRPRSTRSAGSQDPPPPVKPVQYPEPQPSGGPGRPSLRLIIIMIVFVLGLCSYFSRPTSSGPSSVDPSPTAEIVPTRTPVKSNTPTPYKADCRRWSEIIPSMAGREMCVYGTVFNLVSLNETSTRISFNAEANRFFIYVDSTNFVFPDLMKKGGCVVANGTVQLYAHAVPIMVVSELYNCEPWMQ